VDISLKSTTSGEQPEETAAVKFADGVCAKQNEHNAVKSSKMVSLFFT
jgi:hypothetical protein